MEIVLATRNADKVREIEAIMASLDLTLVPLDRFDDVPEVVEDGDTLEANALKKARVVRDATGLCALSDDTGLEVSALAGAPGVCSSRYAGEDASYGDNTRKLLEALVGVSGPRRDARFRCVVALALLSDVANALEKRLRDRSPAGSGNMDAGSITREAGAGRPDALIGEGILAGRIAESNRGASGFGYDPVFEIVGSGKTLAELTLDEKNRVSHRYRALIEMRELMLRMELCGER